MRYSKNMARDIVAGSNELGGLGMLDFYTEQGILNIQILLKVLADNQLVGDMTRITIHKWKWHLGSGNNPFWEHKYQYPQDESQWLQNVRRFAVQNGIETSIILKLISLIKEENLLLKSMPGIWLYPQATSLALKTPFRLILNIHLF